MTDDLALLILEASNGDAQARQTIEKFYPGASVVLPDNPETSRGWMNTSEKTGWYCDGVNPDLGPYNGSNPLQELMKANYLFATFMINNKLITHDVMSSESDILGLLKKKRVTDISI